MQISPNFSTSCLLACSAPRRRWAAPPAALGRLPGHLLLALAPTRRARPSPPPFCLALALSSPCHAHKTACRPPPRRRRGGLTAAPQRPISRAHKHYKYPSKLIRELFRLFLASTLQNTAAAPLEPRQARPHRRTPSSALPRPHSTSPAAPPCPGAAPPPLLLAQSPPEQHRRRFPSSNSRRSPLMP